MRVYSYLGPAGTFTEAALKQVPEAAGQQWTPQLNVTLALQDVATGRSDAAMIAIENSIDGGVSATQDALANMPQLQILGEYLVPVSFVLVTAPGVEITAEPVIAAHPVAYAQCRIWLEQHLPRHRFIPASSNAQAAADLFEEGAQVTAALAPPTITEHLNVTVHATEIADNPDAQTRFLLVGRRQAIGEASGHDKTSLIIELPDDRPGSLLTLLEQFSARGVNLTHISSRPTGDRMGRYRFFIDAEGHIREERVKHAVMGARMHSRTVQFLGSFRRADGAAADTDVRNSDAAFRNAAAWLQQQLDGAAD